MNAFMARYVLDREIHRLISNNSLNFSELIYYWSNRLTKDYNRSILNRIRYIAKYVGQMMVIDASIF